MQDEVALPFVSAASPFSIIKWIADLGVLIDHPRLNDEEKILWVWLATQCADNMSLSCSLTYEQISRAMNKPPRLVHRILFRLLITGFLIADIPIFYGEPTPEMVQKVREIELIVTYRSRLIPKEDNALVLPRNRCEKIILNKLRAQSRPL